MDRKITFYVTRHGETMYNILNKVQGWSDTPLTPRGIKIARLLGKKHGRYNFTKWWRRCFNCDTCFYN